MGLRPMGSESGWAKHRRRSKVKCLSPSAPHFLHLFQASPGGAYLPKSPSPLVYYLYLDLNLRTENYNYFTDFWIPRSYHSCRHTTGSQQVLLDNWMNLSHGPGWGERGAPLRYKVSGGTQNLMIKVSNISTQV